jgi:hypothetical protein
MAAWTPAWDGLLDFKPKGGPQTMTRGHTHEHARGSHGGSAKMTLGVIPPPAIGPGKIAQFGSDLAWKTILGSVVDVEGIGEVGVVRVLQEIWKRGGGDAVGQSFILECLAHICRSPRSVFGQTYSSHCLGLLFPKIHLYRPLEYPHPLLTTHSLYNSYTT